MNHFANRLTALGILSGLALIGSFMTSHHAALQAAAGGPTVTIDPTELPLPVQGSLGVSGTVAATQNGSWNVGIVGTPFVSIANANPLAVRDPNIPQKIPFLHSDGSLGGDPGAATGPLNTFSIPANQRLEVEFVSCTGSTSQTPEVFSFSVAAFDSTKTFVGNVQLFARDAFLAAGAPESVWGSEAKVLLHVPAGGSLGFQATHSAVSQPWGAACMATGYLVSVP